jgi:hypothetical protein
MSTHEIASFFSRAGKPPVIRVFVHRVTRPVTVAHARWRGDDERRARGDAGEDRRYLRATSVQRDAV